MPLKAIPGVQQLIAI